MLTFATFLLLSALCVRANDVPVPRPPNASRSRITLQLRPVGNCDDSSTSEPIFYAEEGKRDYVCLTQSVLADENDLSDVVSARDQNGKLNLILRFREKGARRLKESTARIVKEKVAILINGEIIAVASLLEPISTDLELLGKSGDDELQTLVNSLKSQLRSSKPVRNPNRTGT